MKEALLIGLDGFGEKGYDHLTWCVKPFSGVELPLVDLRRKALPFLFSEIVRGNDWFFPFIPGRLLWKDRRQTKWEEAVEKG